MQDGESTPPRAKKPKNPAGKGPVFIALSQVPAIADPAARLAALFERLEHVWQVATDSGYTNKRGEWVSDPDSATQVRVVECAAELCGAKVGGAAAPERPATVGGRPLPDLSVFNGGKGPQKAVG